MPSDSSRRWWKMVQGLKLFSLILQTIGGFLSAGWWKVRLKSIRKVSSLIPVWYEAAHPLPTFTTSKCSAFFFKCVKFEWGHYSAFWARSYFSKSNGISFNALLGFARISQRITIISASWNRRTVQMRFISAHMGSFTSNGVDNETLPCH